MRKPELPSRPDPAHFLVVEDENMFRKVIMRELSERNPGCSFVEVRKVAELAQIPVVDAKFSLAIVDLDLPDGFALDWASETAQCEDAPPIVILSSLKPSQEFIVHRAVEAGIPGFVHKNDEIEILHQAVSVVMAGGVFFSPFVQQMRRKIQANPDFFNKILTQREQEMLRHIGDGRSNDEIAEIMAVRVVSVVERRKRIMHKLDLHKERDLVRYAIAKGFSKI